jgi:CheY-like chemotaxis protein
MGGKISVASVLDKGATFTVELPFPYIGPPIETPEVGYQPEGFDGDISLRVLVADDNPTNQLVLKTLLNQVGIDPVVVSDGLQAVDTWRGAEWDLVFMDIQMPRMDGRAAAVEIRRMEAESGRRRTPIYALSANAMAHQSADYLKAGMDGHIAKPVEIRELFRVLEDVLETGEAGPDSAEEIMNSPLSIKA